MAPNRHCITFTCVHPQFNNGQPHRAQAPQIITGDLATAQAQLAAEIARYDADPNKFAGILSEFGLHSWHEAAMAPWGRAPMAGIPGPDEDENEITDIPRARRW